MFTPMSADTVTGIAIGLGWGIGIGAWIVRQMRERPPTMPPPPTGTTLPPDRPAWAETRAVECPRCGAIGEEREP